MTRLIRAVFVFVVGGLALSCSMLPAQAVTGPTSGSATTHSGAGYQSFYWNKADKKIRLVSSATSQLSTSRCIDGFFDWQTSSGHYDSRVIRICKPGGYVETDPGGNGWWAEDWGPRTITGVQRLVSYVMDDTSFDIYSVHTEVVYGGLPGSIPATSSGQRYARVRTLYQNGDTASTANTQRYHCSGGNIAGTDICI